MIAASAGRSATNGGAFGSAMIIAGPAAGGEFFGEQFLTMAVLVFHAGSDGQAPPSLTRRVTTRRVTSSSAGSLEPDA